MKRRQLERQLTGRGAVFHRHGARHDIWRLANGRLVAIPRHTEINEHTARAILGKAKEATE